MDPDTDMGGAVEGFPATRCSVVRAAGSPDPDIRRHALDYVVASYWKPVYKYLRFKGRFSNEDAKDLTQGFFARALEKGFFEKYDATKARFRTYLRVCLDGFVANERQSANRIKRGGATHNVSLDFETAESELPRLQIPAGASPEEVFDREWLRELFTMAVERFRLDCEATGKQVHFALFERYDLTDASTKARPTYAHLAEEFDLATTQVTNYLSLARRQFRQVVLDQLRMATGSDVEFQDEARRLLGFQNHSEPTDGGVQP